MSRRTAVHALVAATAAAAGLLTAAPAGAGPAAPEPAAVAFAFASSRDGDSEIYRRTAQGALVQLTHNDDDDYGPVWSPDGQWLAFVSSRDGDPEIYVMDAHGKRVRQLTANTTDAEGAPVADSAPAWSPDGTRLAFASTRDGGEPEIYSMRADGSGAQRLTRTEPFVMDHEPAWSPDGRSIAFSSNRVGFTNVEIFVMAADGSRVRRVTTTEDGVDDNSPAWAPNGRRLAFSSNRAGQHDLYTMTQWGRAVRQVTGDPGLDDVFPRWTADSTQLVFQTFAREDLGLVEGVWIVDRDGSDRRRLTGEGEPGFGGDPEPTRTRP